jgi:hypothetical protein
MPRRIKPPMPTGTTEVQLSPRTATPRIPSIKPQRMGRLHRHRLRQEARPSPHPGSMAIVVAWLRPQTETSTRRQTAMFTRTPGAVGTKLRALLSPLRVTQGPTLLLLKATEDKKEAAELRPGAEEGAVVVGNPGRIALVVRQAAAVAAAGAAAGNPETRSTEVSLMF